MVTRIKAVYVLVGVKLFFVFLAIFAPFSHPHIIRQNDSLGISIRYWLRWTVEPSLQHPIFPALIQSGDAYGIHATEFPIMYILFAPIQALPTPWNIFASRFLWLILTLALTWLSYKVWKKSETKTFDAGIVHALMLIFGVTNVFFSRFMPDYLSFILVSIAVGYSYDKPRALISLPLAALGMLLKPLAVLGFGVLLLKKPNEILKNILYWILPAFIITVLYYIFGIKYLNSLSDIDPYFHSSFRNPFTQLMNFFSEPGKIFKMLFRDIFSTYILIFILFDFLRSKLFKDRYQLKLWGILVLQIIGGAILDGDHIFIHYYYYVATGFIVAIIFSDYLKRVGKIALYTVMIVLSLFTLEKSFYSVREVFSNHMWWQCGNLKSQLPVDEYKIRTNPLRYALLGPCMKMIQNSKTAKYGVFEDKEKMPEGGSVLVDEKDLNLLEFNK